jgi:hypothetical protein
VDCILNIGQTNFTSENFSDQPVDIKLSDGVIIKDFKIGDEPFTSTCDYMKCDFTCKDSKNKKMNIINSVIESNINDSTYNIEFSTTNTGKIIEIIKRLMSDSFFYKKMDLVSYINHDGGNKFPIHLIDLALTFLISKKTPIMDKYKRSGTLVNIGEYYLFQPKTIDVSHLSIQDRSMKLKVNYNVISYKDIIAPAADEDKDVEIERGNINQEVHPGQAILIREYDLYNHTLELSKQEPIYIKHKTIAHYFGEAIYFIGGENNQPYLTLLIHSLFDRLPIQNKIDLIDFILINDFKKMNYDVRDKLESSLFLIELLKYIKSKTFENKRKRYLYFISDPILKKEDIELTPGTFYRINSLNGTETLEKMDIMHQELYTEWSKTFKIDPLKFTIEKRSLNNIVGFIGYHNNKNNMIFKTKGIKPNAKRNPQILLLKGTNCSQAIPKNVLRDIDAIDVESKHALFADEYLDVLKKTKDDNKNKFSKDFLCALMELMLRRLDQLHTNDKIWFVSTEIAVVFQF